MTNPDITYPPTVSPSEQGEDTRHRLLRSAVQVFDQKGYSAASVREIVELAGVSKPALYYHFGNKEHLFLAVLEGGVRAFETLLAAALAREGTAAERLTALCENIDALFARNAPVVRVVHAVFHSPSGGMPPFDVSVFDRRLSSAVERIVTDGIASGQVRDVRPRDVAVVVMGIITACAATHMHSECCQLEDGQLGRLLGLVCDGLLVGPRRPGEEGR